MEMQQKDVDHQVEINQLNEQLQTQARNFQDEKAMLEREKHEALDLAQKTIRDQGKDSRTALTVLSANTDAETCESLIR